MFPCIIKFLFTEKNFLPQLIKKENYSSPVKHYLCSTMTCYVWEGLFIKRQTSDRTSDTESYKTCDNEWQRAVQGVKTNGNTKIGKKRCAIAWTSTHILKSIVVALLSRTLNKTTVHVNFLSHSEQLLTRRTISLAFFENTFHTSNKACGLLRLQTYHKLLSN